MSRLRHELERAEREGHPLPWSVVREAERLHRPRAKRMAPDVRERYQILCLVLFLLSAAFVLWLLYQGPATRTRTSLPRPQVEQVSTVHVATEGGRGF